MLSTVQVDIKASFVKHVWSSCEPLALLPGGVGEEKGAFSPPIWPGNVGFWAMESQAQNPTIDKLLLQLVGP